MKRQYSYFNPSDTLSLRGGKKVVKSVLYEERIQHHDIHPFCIYKREILVDGKLHNFEQEEPALTIYNENGVPYAWCSFKDGCYHSYNRKPAIKIVRGSECIKVWMGPEYAMKGQDFQFEHESVSDSGDTLYKHYRMNNGIYNAVKTEPFYIFINASKGQIYEITFRPDENGDICRDVEYVCLLYRAGVDNLNNRKMIGGKSEYFNHFEFSKNNESLLTKKAIRKPLGVHKGVEIDTHTDISVILPDGFYDFYSIEYEYKDEDLVTITQKYGSEVDNICSPVNGEPSYIKFDYSTNERTVKYYERGVLHRFIKEGASQCIRDLPSYDIKYESYHEFGKKVNGPNGYTSKLVKNDGVLYTYITDNKGKFDQKYVNQQYFKMFITESFYTEVTIFENEDVYSMSFTYGYSYSFIDSFSVDKKSLMIVRRECVRTDYSCYTDEYMYKLTDDGREQLYARKRYTDDKLGSNYRPAVSLFCEETGLPKSESWYSDGKKVLSFDYKIENGRVVDITNIYQKLHNTCFVCFVKDANFINNCGHLMCKACWSRVPECPFCKQCVKNVMKIVV